MLLTIALIIAATIALAALELWLFWRMGDRDARRRIGMRADIPAADAEPRATGTRPGGQRGQGCPPTAQSRL